MSKTFERTGADLSARRPGLIERFERWLEDRRRRRAEDYLCKAESIYDLENRMRQMAREMDHLRFMRPC